MTEELERLRSKRRVRVVTQISVNCLDWNPRAWLTDANSAAGAYGAIVTGSPAHFRAAAAARDRPEVERLVFNLLLPLSP